MNFNKISFLFFVLIFFQTSFLSAQIINWQYEDVLTDEFEAGANADMLIDDNGNIHLSFWNKETDKLWYGRRSKANAIWTYEEVDLIHEAGYVSALKLDAAGKVHIAYLESQSGKAWLRYATNKTGNWNTEVVSDSSIGIYGPDLDAGTYVKSSVDIELDPQGEPMISYFDASIQKTFLCPAQVGLNLPEQAHLNLILARRQSLGVWSYTAFHDSLINLFNACPQSIQSGRVGEFCNLIPLGIDSLAIVASSLYNNRLIAWVGNYNSLRQAKKIVLDSVARILIPQSIRWEDGFGSINTTVVGDSALHLIYNFSEGYGQRATITSRGNIRNVYYAKLPLAAFKHGTNAGISFSEQAPPPRDNHLRTYNSFALHGADTIFSVHFNANTSDAVMLSSTDGGASWQSDTLHHRFSTTIASKCAVFGDSVFVTFYDARKEKIVLSSRAIPGGAWHHEAATSGIQRGAYIGATVVRRAGDDQVHIVFTEKCEGQLVYGKRILGMWTYQNVDIPNNYTKSLDLQLDALDLPNIAYVSEISAKLKFARWNGSSWDVETISTVGKAEAPSLQLVGDSAHICFYDLAQQVVSIASSKLGSGQWAVHALDTLNKSHGRFAVLKAQSQGLHLAYYDADRLLIRYGHRPIGGAWQIRDASPDSINLPVSGLDMEVGVTGEVHIAFRDGLNNKVFIAENVQSGWATENPIPNGSSIVGHPLDLLLNSAGTPWLLYSYTSNTQELRLVRREGNHWRDVSVTPNQVEMSDVFRFLLVEDDFYIIGKKNQAGNKGIGLLHAANGATTAISKESLATKLSLWPNPLQSDQAFLKFDLKKSATVSLAIFNMNGQKVAQPIHSKVLLAGQHELSFSASQLSTGIYIWQMQVGGEIFRGKLMKY